MENWDEVRTAYHVARCGTVSGAADTLGVHHATVIRHIDAIEARLGVKLFQRHARGYTPTEAGQDLLRVAQTTDDQFSQLMGRLKGQGDAMSGELVITSLASMAGLLTPILSKFQQIHPDLMIRYLTGDRLFRLEYGEAHVALRAGTAPKQLDNVVQPFMFQQIALYASQEYVARFGMLKNEGDFANHWFVGSDTDVPRASHDRWLRSNVPLENIRFRCTDQMSGEAAVKAGAGIGFVNKLRAAQDETLIQMLVPKPEWTSNIWLVTHVDLHRTNKVQSFIRFLKEETAGWSE